MKSKTVKTVSIVVSLIVATFVFTLVNELMRNDLTNLQLFRSEEGRFKVDMPKDPEKYDIMVNTEVGPIKAIAYGKEIKNYTFAVVFADYPKEMVESFTAKYILDGARAGAAANVHGKVLSETILNLKGFEGREVKIESPNDIIIKVRIYLVGMRLYQAIVVTAKEHIFDKKVVEFLESFEFDDE